MATLSEIGDDRTGVDATRQEDSDRNVGQQLQFHSLLPGAAQMLKILGRKARPPRTIGQGPVAALDRFPDARGVGQIELPNFSGQQRLHTGHERVGRLNGTKPQVAIQTALGQLPLDQPRRQDRPHL